MQFPRAARVLIVHSHPVLTSTADVAPSFTRAMAASMESGLSRSGVDVRRFDLDQNDFQPLLSEHERLNYFEESKQPQLTSDSNVAELVDGLRWCDGLALAYPTWLILTTVFTLAAAVCISTASPVTAPPWFALFSHWLQQFECLLHPL